MKKIKDGGPAFARTGSADIHGYGVSDQVGLSLRDYLAAKAMQGLLANSEGTAVMKHVDDGILTLRGIVGIPMLAYEYADAMLAQRSKA